MTTNPLAAKTLTELLESLSALKLEALAALGRVTTQDELQAWRRKYIAGPKREKDHDADSR